jgi:branched-chain amino acid transport system substrate-binding protein
MIIGPVAKRARALIAITLVAGGIGAARADVEIAVIRALSGSGATDSTRDMEFTVARINDAGGVLGQKLHVQFFDDGCDAEQGVVAAQLALAQHASLIIGPECSASSIREAPMYAAAHVIEITTAATGDELTDMKLKTVFRMIGRNSQQGEAAASLIEHRWPRARIAIIDDHEPFGQGLASSLRQSLSARKIPIALSRSFEMDAPSYADVISALNRAKIDLVYIAGYSEDIGVLLHEMRSAGLTAQVLSGDPGAGDKVRLVAGSATEGMLVTASRDPLQYPSVKALIGQAHEKGFEMTPFAAVTCAALQVWIETVQQVQSLDADKVAEAMHKNRFDTVVGQVAFDANGNVVGERGEWIWYRWHDGQLKVESSP